MVKVPRVLVASWGLGSALLLLMVGLSVQFGATWDEKVQHEYGKLVYRYFADVVQINARRFGSVVYTPASDGDAQLHIELLRGSLSRIRELMREPAVVVVRTADGAPLCVVQPGPEYRTIAAASANPRRRQVPTLTLAAQTRRHPRL